MTNKPHPRKRQFEFILTLEPKEKLTSEQDSFLFKEGIEKIPRTGLYVRKSFNFLTTFLVLDSLENDSPFLGLSQLEYTVAKKESQ